MSKGTHISDMIRNPLTGSEEQIERLLMQSAFCSEGQLGIEQGFHSLELQIGVYRLGGLQDPSLWKGVSEDCSDGMVESATANIYLAVGRSGQNFKKRSGRG